MAPVYEYAFEVTPGEIPHNRDWRAFDADVRRVSDTKIWIRRQQDEGGPNLLLKQTSGTDDLRVFHRGFVESEAIDLWGIWVPPKQAVLRDGKWELTVLTRPVVDAGTPRILSVAMTELPRGEVRIDASGALSGALMWSATFTARETVRCMQLRDTIHDHLVDQGVLTRSSPPVRLLKDGVAVRGNAVLKHATEFGRQVPASSRYPSTPYMSTIRRYFKRRRSSPY